jgi:DNA-binding CsgD family transcriptional regulator
MVRRSKYESLYRKMHAEGKSCSEIARAAGVSVSAVAQWLRGHGLDVIGDTGNVQDSQRVQLSQDVVTKAIPGYEGYLAGDDGNIYSTRTDPPTALYGRSRSKDSFLRIRMMVKGKVVDQYACTLIAKAWLPPRPLGAKLVFVDDNKHNTKPTNLSWGFTQSHVDMKQFVRCWQKANSTTEVSEEMGISIHQVHQIKKRLTDNNVPLKNFQSEEISYDDLAELAADLLATQEEE